MSSNRYMQVTSDESGLVPSQSGSRPEWPKKLRNLSSDELDRITVDAQGRFYWDGRPVAFADTETQAADDLTAQMAAQVAARVAAQRASEPAPAPAVTTAATPAAQSAKESADRTAAATNKALEHIRNELGLAPLQVERRMPVGPDRASPLLDRAPPPPEPAHPDLDEAPTAHGHQTAPIAAQPDPSAPPTDDEVGHEGPAANDDVPQDQEQQPEPTASAFDQAALVAAVQQDLMQTKTDPVVAEPTTAAVSEPTDHAAALEAALAVPATDVVVAPAGPTRLRLSAWQSVGVIVFLLGWLVAAAGLAATGFTEAHAWSCRAGMVKTWCPAPAAAAAAASKPAAPARRAPGIVD